MSLAGNVGALATRVAEEFNDVRAEAATALAGKANTTHVHSAADITSGTLSAARLPVVTTQRGEAAGGAGTITADATLAANIRTHRITGTAQAITIAVPTGGTDGQVLRFRVYPATSTCTIAFASGIRPTTGLTAGPHTVDAGKIAVFALEYVAPVGAAAGPTVWLLTAYTAG